MKEFHKRRIHKRREHVHWRNLSPKKETITARSISQDYWLTSNRANFLVEWAVRIIFYEGISLRKKLSEKIARFSTQKIDPSTGVTMDWSRGWQGLFESLSLGYPILVWNKKSILNKYVGCAAVFWYTRRGFGPLPVCDHSQGVYSYSNMRWSIVFRVLFQQTNKHTNEPVILPCRGSGPTLIRCLQNEKCENERHNS